ncbi:MAG: undecaprenyl/decaprenyl-phosphate alpha-N-acetylglucosaminyl 1-phosphate transferase [Sedimentisphaerales bacterium]|nr:undecaprenyl/decaprenyl-phosphate alpha-N-acetylglucosaminyl 1-phosphate transferase [Sedimentisphaerales bacterium]
MTSSTVLEIALIVGGSAFLVAFSVGMFLVSKMCHISWRMGAIDKPDGFLKCHVRPTATLGGVPLFGATLVGMLVIISAFYGTSNAYFNPVDKGISWGAVLVASLIILSVGISDDIRQVMPRTKFLFQLMAATILVSSGLAIRQCSFFGLFEFSLGMFAIPFTLFWLVGSCNAFNFIDGMDGLAAGIGTVIASALAVLGFANGAWPAAFLAITLAGSLLAILLFNIRPAKIFMGDSGSQLAGLLLGMLAIQATTVNGVISLPSAGIVLSIPIIDAFLSILRRYSISESPACGDHKHIHHCLRLHGFKVNNTAVTLWIAAALCGTMALFTQFIPGRQTAVAAIMFVAMEFYVGIRLGCLNPKLLWQKITGGFRQQPQQDSSSNRHMAELETLWKRMEPLFDQMHLDRVVLTLEGVNEQGLTNRQTYRWVRSNELMADLLHSQWTKRFSVDSQGHRIATLRLESADQLHRDEERIDWLVNQISDNVRLSKSGLSRPKKIDFPLELTA